MSRVTALHREIDGLANCIEFLHVLAWKYRMNNDVVCMNGVHWAIQACKRRIDDCQWQIAKEDNSLAGWAVFGAFLMGLLTLECLAQKL